MEKLNFTNGHKRQTSRQHFLHSLEGTLQELSTLLDHRGWTTREIDQLIKIRGALTTLQAVFIH